jgi:hypothetical protein
MAGWNLVRARFFLTQEYLLGRIMRGVDETKSLERIDLPNPPGTPIRRGVPVPGPTALAISVAAYIEKVTGTCPLCGHDEDAEVSDDEEESD